MKKNEKKMLFTYNYTVVLLYTDWSKLFVRSIVLALQAAV